MKLKSLNNILLEITSIINTNPIASTIGVIANDYSGEEVLIRNIKELYEPQSNTKVIVVNAQNIICLEDFRSYLVDLVVEDFSKDAVKELMGDNYTDLILGYLSLISEYNILRLILIIYNFGFLDIELQYLLASQLRNAREKNKYSELKNQLHSIVLGKFSYFEHSRLCKKYGTSFTLDDIIYLNSSTLLEIKNIVILSNYSLHPEYNIELINEFSGGNIGLIIFLLKHLNNSQEGISFSLNSSLLEEIKDTIKVSYDVLNAQHKVLMCEIIDGRSKKLKFNSRLEELYLSGLFRIDASGTDYYVSIRSCIHEQIVREILSSSYNIFSCYNQLLPPIYSINTAAYKLLMEIENTLRNIVILKLSKYSYKGHPLEILNCLGKQTRSENGNEYFLYDWCKHKVRQLREVYNLDAHEALVSQIGLKDLELIFVSKNKIETDPFCSLSDIFKDIFPDQIYIREVFSRLRTIRNAVAHNNMITNKVIRELVTIKKQILKA